MKWQEDAIANQLISSADQKVKKESRLDRRLEGSHAILMLAHFERRQNQNAVRAYKPSYNSQLNNEQI